MSEGLICMFCGKDGFDNQEDLEEHIESHPNVRKKERFK